MADLFLIAVTQGAQSAFDTMLVEFGVVSFLVLYVIILAHWRL